VETDVSLAAVSFPPAALPIGTNLGERGRKKEEEAFLSPEGGMEGTASLSHRGRGEKRTSLQRKETLNLVRFIRRERKGGNTLYCGREKRNISTEKRERRNAP